MGQLTVNHGVVASLYSQHHFPRALVFTKAFPKSTCSVSKSSGCESRVYTWCTGMGCSLGQTSADGTLQTLLTLETKATNNCYSIYLSICCSELFQIQPILPLSFVSRFLPHPPRPRSDRRPSLWGQADWRDLDPTSSEENRT